MDLGAVVLPPVVAGLKHLDAVLHAIKGRRRIQFPGTSAEGADRRGRCRPRRWRALGLWPPRRLVGLGGGGAAGSGGAGGLGILGAWASGGPRLQAGMNCWTHGTPSTTYILRRRVVSRVCPASGHCSPQVRRRRPPHCQDWQYARLPGSSSGLLERQPREQGLARLQATAGGLNDPELGSRAAAAWSCERKA